MARKLPKKIEKILAETKGRLSALYSQRLKDVILIGSYARGDYEKGSDLDLLLLIDGMVDPDLERERYSRPISDLALKHDTVLSVIPMDYEMYLSRKTPLILNARREGVRI